MPIDLEFLEGKRWFAQKGLNPRISIIDRVRLGEYEILILSALSDSINKKPLFFEKRGHPPSPNISLRDGLPSVANTSMPILSARRLATLSFLNDEKYTIPIHIESGKESDSDPRYLNNLIEKMNSSAGINEAGEITFSSYREIPPVKSAEIHFSGTSNVLSKADSMISKSYRRLRKNNYEAEVIRWLCDRNFRSVPDCYGEARYNGMCFHAFYGFVEGVDAGKMYYRDALDFIEKRTLGVDAQELGMTIRELHRNLDNFIDPPEYSIWRGGMKKMMRARLKFLAGFLGKPDLRSVEDAVKNFLHLTEKTGKLQMTHGDLHLGQILYSKNGYKFIDFEGEPDHDSPPVFPRERDVASVIRSLDYVIKTLPGCDHDLGQQWSERIADEIMDGYGIVNEKVYPWLIERAIYEICYEAKNRPENMKIPLQGLKELM